MFRFPNSLAICCVAWSLTGSLGAAQQAAHSATPAAPASEKANAKPKKAADPQALPDAKHREAAAPAPTAKPASTEAQAKTKGDPAATPAPAAGTNPMTGAVAQGGTSPASSGSKAAKPAPAQTGAKAAPTCAIEEPEQPRGGRLDLIGSGFGQSPVVRIAGKPARMIERREDRLVVQVPVDSNGGAVTVQAQGQSQTCGSLVIIGKNR